MRLFYHQSHTANLRWVGRHRPLVRKLKVKRLRAQSRRTLPRQRGRFRKPEPKPEVKELAATEAAASVPLPPTPAAVLTDAPTVPPKSPSTPPPVPAESEKPSESAPATPTKTNGIATVAASAPSTPKKTAFPSDGGDEGSSSPSSVRSRLGSVRKKASVYH